MVALVQLLFMGLEQVHELVTVLSRLDSYFFYVLAKFDNCIFPRVTTDLNWPLNQLAFLSKFDNSFLYAF